MSNRYKQISKLINAGYPILYGIAFLILTMLFAFKFVTNRAHDGLSVNEVLIPILIVSVTTFLGILLIKIGVEAKKKEDY